MRTDDIFHCLLFLEAIYGIGQKIPLNFSHESAQPVLPRHCKRSFGDVPARTVYFVRPCV